MSKDVFTKLRAQTESRKRQGWRQVMLEVVDEDRLSKNTKRVLAR